MPKEIVLCLCLFLSIAGLSQHPERSINMWQASALKKQIYTTHPILPIQSSSDTNLRFNKESILGLSGLKLTRSESKDFFFSVKPLIAIDAGSNLMQQDYSVKAAAGLDVNAHYKDKLYLRGQYSLNYLRNFAFIDAYISENRNYPGKALPMGNFLNNGSFSLDWQTSEHINLKAGFDKHFIGKGYRSLFLSDAAYNYPYAGLTADVWKFSYTALWAKMKDIRHNNKTTWNQFSDKYMAFHYLSWQIHPRFRIGFFESIVWQGSDESGERGFEINYLNPVIFFRPVEYNVGSPDNALLGFDMDYHAGDQLFYFQLMLDEFKLEEIRAMNGWWGNKQAFQLGWRSFDIFNTQNFHSIFEFNYIRPFMYSHRTPLQSYGHYNQPLAHPIGANGMEGIVELSFSHQRWYFLLRNNYLLYGTDPDNRNFGRDIFKDYDTRVKDYNNFIGQGNENHLMHNVFYVAYLLNQDLGLHSFLRFTHRYHTNQDKTNSGIYVQLGLSTFLRDEWFDYL